MTLSYDDALSYLYGLINYEIKRPERYTPEVISLERPRRLMTLLGDPQQRYPVVHVTGTKGKGSVSASCASMLEANGLKVGLYSSPNLQDFRERFRLNGALIPRERLTALVEEMQPVAAQIPGITWWEVITGIAFLYFAQEQVDIAVIEVGLGGRLDATNIVQDPIAAVITSLSYDHMYLLGHTLAEIAGEKAGIIKPGRPVISAPQPEEGLLVVEQVAAERKSPLILVGRDYHYQVGLSTPDGQQFFAGSTADSMQTYWTPLLGAHQALNGAVAMAAMEAVRASGMPLDNAALQTGLHRVNWPGRLEVVSRTPWLILDAAHNGDSALRLREALTTIFPATRRVVIFGASNDKDVDGMFSALLPAVDHLILTQADNARAFPIPHLQAIAHGNNFQGTITQIPHVIDALRTARSEAAPDSLICVTGSLFVVGEARTCLGLLPERAHYLDEASVLHQMNAG